MQYYITVVTPLEKREKARECYEEEKILQTSLSAKIKPKTFVDFSTHKIPSKHFTPKTNVFYLNLVLENVATQNDRKQNNCHLKRWRKYKLNK